MASWSFARRHAGAAVKGLFVIVCVYCVSGWWLPSAALADAQLVEFMVGDPPPPDTEPAPSSGTDTGAVATAASDLPVNDPTVGTLVGQANTDGGAAVYSVSVVVPPGRAGMQPGLSLNYHSRSGNGVMGVGWAISGLSSIHRCPLTPEQDGQSLGVAYAATDKLCLDGQRLVAVAGTYGAAGTEYRTEIDSYARIFQAGGGLTGTSPCFRVEQKDGRIYHYGAVVTGTSSLSCLASTANSRVQPTGAAATLSWLVEKIED